MRGRVIQLRPSATEQLTLIAYKSGRPDWSITLTDEGDPTLCLTLGCGILLVTPETGSHGRFSVLLQGADGLIVAERRHLDDADIAEKLSRLAA